MSKVQKYVIQYNMWYLHTHATYATTKVTRHCDLSIHLTKRTRNSDFEIYKSSIQTATQHVIVRHKEIMSASVVISITNHARKAKGTQEVADVQTDAQIKCALNFTS